MRQFRRVRASGGHLSHIVECYGDRTSLCGHKPGGNTRMGQRRAGWCIQTTCLGARLCEKCEKRFSKLTDAKILGPNESYHEESNERHERQV